MHNPPHLRRGKREAVLLGFLGFSLDSKHCFGIGFPLYTQVSRAGLVLHLSEYHGDASPGATASVRTEALHAFHRGLAGKEYPHGKPDVEEQPWGLVMMVTDPFSNRLRFYQERPRT